MEKADILSALPNLSPRDPAEILEKLWQLEEAAEPSAGEKAVLDAAQARFEANPDAGVPWNDVAGRLRRRAA